jgi:hypothetical protein
MSHRIDRPDACRRDAQRGRAIAGVLDLLPEEARFASSVDLEDRHLQ